jgi:hypothetical protein
MGIAVKSPMGKAPAETGSVADPLVYEQLHRAAIEHVEHTRISRAAPGSVIAHKVVNAHAWPAGAGAGTSLRRWRRCSAIATWWWRLQRSIVVRARSRTGSSGRLRMWGRRGSAWLITIRALGRGLARRLRSVVGLRSGGRSARVGRGRGACWSTWS